MEAAKFNIIRDNRYDKTLKSDLRRYRLRRLAQKWGNLYENTLATNLIT